MESGRGKLLLADWLRQQIDSGNYPGLQWLDRERQIFRIPWKHGGRQEFNEQRDASIFKAWADYTGKSRSIRGRCTDWKCNFRNCLNKIMIHCDNLDNQRDRCDPYRVYMYKCPQEFDDGDNNDDKQSAMLDVTNQSIMDSDSSQSQDAQHSVHDDNSEINGQIPHLDLISSPPLSYSDVKLTAEPCPVYGNQLSLETIPSGLSNVEPGSGKLPDSLDLPSTEIFNPVTLAKNTDASSSDIKTETEDMEVDQADTHDGSIQVQLSMRFPTDMMTVKCKYVSNDEMNWDIQGSCLLCYNTTNDSCDTNIITLPHPNTCVLSEDQESNMNTILENSRKGIFLECDSQGNIFVIRKSRIKVYVELPMETLVSKDRLLKLKRHEKTKIFDFQKNFVMPLQNALEMSKALPEAFVKLSLGQRWEKDPSTWQNVAVSIQVASKAALDIIEQVNQHKAFEASVDVSLPSVETQPESCNTAPEH